MPEARMLVYLVDDDRAMVQSTGQWLSLCGLSVRSFTDPGLMLRAVRPGLPGVVVSDIRMPLMDGLQLLREVHAREPRLPVIFITGHGDVPLAVRAMKAGAFDFFTKPFSPEDLLAAVTKAGAVARADFSRAGETRWLPKGAPAGLDTGSGGDASLPGRIEQYEKTMIMDALNRHGGRMAEVVAELSIPRRTLNEKMRKFGLARKDFAK